MKIHPLTTGTVRLKHAFLYAREGWRRQLDLFLPGQWSGPVPIHCWAIEHAGRLVLVDTGESAAVNDVPFARFDVTPEDELPNALSSAGLRLEDLDTVVLTHMHGDHMDGAVHVRSQILVSESELAHTRTPSARAFQRLLRQPIPAGVDFTAMALSDGPFGAFAASRRLSEDGRIVAVATPGHTPGHISVICVDDDGRHILLAGDTTDTLEQLRSLRADAVGPKPAVSIETMRRILAHASKHPTVYLPAHDLESVTRLRDRATL